MGHGLFWLNIFVVFSCTSREALPYTFYPNFRCKTCHTNKDSCMCSLLIYRTERQNSVSVLLAAGTDFGKRINYSTDSIIPSIAVIFCFYSWLLARLNNDAIVKLCPLRDMSVDKYRQYAVLSASTVLFIHPTSPSRVSLPTLLSFPPLLQPFSHTSVSLANQPAIDTMAMLPNLSKGKSLP